MPTKTPPKKSKKKAVKPKQSPAVFSGGVLLFLVGILGLGYDFWLDWQRPVEQILPSDTEFFVEVSPQKLPEQLSFAEAVFPLVPVDFSRYVEGISAHDASNWLSSKLTFGGLPERELFLAAKIRSKKSAKKFFQTAFLLPDENFIEKELESGHEILIPEFSAGLALTFWKDWLIMTSSEAALTSFLAADQSLFEAEKFLHQNSLRSGNNFLRGFFRSSVFLESLPEANNKKALLSTFAEVMPNGVFAAQAKNGKIELQFKIKTSGKDLFLSQKNNLPAVVPELAQFADSDALFFMNGVDLYQNYRQAHNFLEQLHPEFAMIFDGILRAETEEIFGEKFDFSADFLGKMHGQYALIVDFEDNLIPFPKMVLVTGFGKSDTEQKIKDFHETLRFSQGKHSTKIQTTTLPNGRTREEIVATDSGELFVDKIKGKVGEFYKVTNQDSDQVIWYGFLKNYFVFSTDQMQVWKIFNGEIEPLTESDSFRNLVLFSNTKAESYGIMDLPKIALMLENAMVPDEEAESVEPPFVSTLAQKYGKVLFNQNNHPEYLEWNFVLE